jgi:tetratricopeptide (TPR) repeat protein
MYLIRLELANQMGFADRRLFAMAQARRALAHPGMLDTQGTIEALATLGEGHKFACEPQLAEEAYLRALKLIGGLGDNDLLGQCYQALGEAWFFNKDYARAISYYQQASDALQNTHEVDFLILAWSQAAYAYDRIGDHEQQKYWLQKGVTDSRIPAVHRGLFLQRIALSQAKSHRLAEAVVSYEQALSIYEALGFKRLWQARIQELAQMYRDLGDESAAQRTLERS